MAESMDVNTDWSGDGGLVDKSPMDWDDMSLFFPTVGTQSQHSPHHTYALSDPTVDMLGAAGEYKCGDSGRLDVADVDLPRQGPSVSGAKPMRSGRPRSCSQCHARFPSGHELELHAIEQKHRTYACQARGCDKKYCRRDAYNRHVAAHRLDTPHSCPTCWATFARKDHMTRHERLQHPQAEDDGERTSGVAGLEDAEMLKVVESESTLRERLSPENLAIKMLNIVSASKSKPEEVQKAFACMVAQAALNAPETLPQGTKERLLSVPNPQEICPRDSGLFQTETGLRGSFVYPPASIL